MEPLRTPYGLEEHLKAICQQAPQFENLYSSWVLNKRSCASALKQVAQNYPHYSVHDELHSKNVISNIEQLLGEERIRKLSPTDTWMLLQLAYLHDFGMLLLYDNIEQEWSSVDFQEYLQECRDSNNPAIKKAADYLFELKDNLPKADFEKTWPLHIRRYTTHLIAGYYRGKHAYLTNQYIADRLTQWGIDLSHNGLIQPRLIKLLGQLSMLHTRNQDDVLKLDYISNGYAADYIHPRFLAEMLRLGDLLDADNSRFEPVAELVTGELPEDSAGHKGKHESTVHLLITPEQIEYRADCPTHAVYRETRVFLDWLENELAFAAINWLNFIPKELGGTAPRLTKKELLLDGKPDIDNTSDLRFDISQEKAFEIIEGSGIYKDKMVFLRELIQNAEDASKIQLWRDLQKRPDLYLNDSANKDDLSHIQPYDLKSEAFDSYKITIDLKKVDDDQYRLRIIDCGTGMSVDTVKQMCKVGNSYYQDKARRREIEAMPNWLRPTAGFGIGLQSVFLVAPSFTIYSRTEEKAIKITVESRKKAGYVQVEEDNKWKKQGTCVEILVPLKVLLSCDGDSILPISIYAQYDDTFSDNNELPYHILSKNVEYETGSCLFPIILTKEDNEWNRFTKLSFQTIAEAPVFMDNYVVFKSNQGGLNVWDKDHATLLNLSITDSDTALATAPSREYIKFKGKIVEVFNNYESCLNKVVDYYGLDTQTYLSITRESFKNAKRQELDTIYCGLMRIAVEFLMMQLEDIPKWLMIQETKEELSSTLDYRYILWNIADDEQKERMIRNCEKYIKPMIEKINVLKWENNSYCVRKHNVSDIILRTSNYIFHSDYHYASDISHMVSDITTQNKLIDYHNKISNKINQGTIVFDRQLRHSLSNKTIGKLWIDCEPEDICFFTLEQTGSCCCQVDTSTKSNLLRILSEDLKISIVGMILGKSVRRRTIPAFAGYEQLALPEKYVSFTGMWSGLSDTHYIISPFLADDPALKFPKDELISHVCQTPEFSNLVNYVLEHHADPTSYTKEDIIDAYKRLISEYYDVMHEDDTSKDESEGE